jgi:hypothetical protein
VAGGADDPPRRAPMTRPSRSWEDRSPSAVSNPPTILSASGPGRAGPGRLRPVSDPPHSRSARPPSASRVTVALPDADASNGGGHNERRAAGRGCAARGLGGRPVLALPGPGRPRRCHDRISRGALSRSLLRGQRSPDRGGSAGCGLAGRARWPAPGRSRRRGRRSRGTGCPGAGRPDSAGVAGLGVGAVHDARPPRLFARLPDPRRPGRPVRLAGHVTPPGARVGENRLRLRGGNPATSRYTAGRPATSRYVARRPVTS